MEQTFNFEYGISREQACILCHLSAECSGCCIKCDHHDGCQGQACSQPFREHEGQRWDTWMYLLREHFPHLEKYITPELRKKYGIDRMLRKKVKTAMSNTYTTPPSVKEATRRAAAASANLLRTHFSVKEQSLICFAPLVLIDVAFSYADACRQYAAKYRLAHMKTVCRAYDCTQRRWQENIASGLDYDHRQHIHHEAERFKQECSNDFARLWFTACNAWNASYPHLPHQHLRVDAICGLLMLDAVHRLSRMNNRLMLQRLGVNNDGSYETDETVQLANILQAFLGVQFDNTPLHAAQNVIINRLITGAYIEANL